MERSEEFQAARSVAGHVAIVTGAGSGIGRGCAETLARAGACVIVTDRDEGTASDVGQALEAAGLNAKSLKLDVSDDEQIEAAVKVAIDQFGGLDILVNNAGINRKVVPGDPGFEKAWQMSLDVMLNGPQKLISAALDPLKRSDCARIVNIASIEGLATSAGNAPYASAKAGILGLTRALAIDLGPFGITVNAVCPGPILTGMTEGLPQNLQQEYLERYTILKRAGQPEDIAHMVLNLCLPASGFMTGASVIVDGGLMARSS